MNKKVLGGFYMALAASIWGGMYVVSKLILTVLQPLLLVWLRYVVALIVLALWMVITRQSWRIHRKDMPAILAIGMIGYTLSIGAQFYGTKLSTAQMGAMITSATPAFMVVFGRIFLGERVTLRRAVSAVLATIGVLMVVGIGGFNRSYQLGGFILVIAALTWALMSVFVKRVPHSYSQVAVTMYAILTATLAITPFVYAPLMRLSPGVFFHPVIFGGVLYLGVVSTAGAFFLWNKGLQWLDAGTGGLYFFFQPLIGTWLGWLILGERVGFLFWIGAFFILLGVSLVIKE
ncbi:DMT family transporter [Ferroacidibacillus organovorans]|uniref:EamA domain-containing protein n=1 Tax=Ferroacidibacillus organovorans TaxID=1765683 RepID=A0A124IW52_9BACL|nr:DMT family transporter [Ferroacidibacillus organovorans]KUO96334.1 hypothetical protein ATW55_03780 [Ferroacidibacillus organovorans]